ncbi:MAG: hypothetical protein AB7N76_01035 [Planctomycetota bacterium]
MGQLDIAAKVLLTEVPEPLVRLFLGDVAIRDLRAEDTELPALARRVDKLLRVELEGEDEPLWLHFEVQASWRSCFPERAFDYWSLVRRRHPHLLTVVLCLAKGDRQGDPIGEFEVRVRGRRRLLFEFDVIRAWSDLDADELLAQGPLELLPLVPFAAHATHDHAEQALTRLDHVADEDKRRELRLALATFAEQAFREEGWLARIPEEELMQFSSWKQVSAEFEAKGEVKGERKVLATLLQRRLGDRAQALVERLEVSLAPELEQVTELLAQPSSDDQLVAALEALLPAAQA